MIWWGSVEACFTGGSVRGRVDKSGAIGGQWRIESVFRDRKRRSLAVQVDPLLRRSAPSSTLLDEPARSSLWYMLARSRFWRGVAVRRGHKRRLCQMCTTLTSSVVLGWKSNKKSATISSDTLACSCEVVRPRQPSPPPHRKTSNLLHILSRFAPLLAPPCVRCLGLDPSRSFFTHTSRPTSLSYRTPSSRPSW